MYFLRGSLPWQGLKVGASSRCPWARLPRGPGSALAWAASGRWGRLCPAGRWVGTRPDAGALALSSVPGPCCAERLWMSLSLRPPCFAGPTLTGCPGAARAGVRPPEHLGVLGEGILQEWALLEKRHQETVGGLTAPGAKPGPHTDLLLVSARLTRSRRGTRRSVTPKGPLQWRCSVRTSQVRAPRVAWPRPRPGPAAAGLAPLSPLCPRRRDGHVPALRAAAGFLREARLRLPAEALHRLVRAERLRVRLRIRLGRETAGEWRGSGTEAAGPWEGCGQHVGGVSVVRGSSQGGCGLASSLPRTSVPQRSAPAATSSPCRAAAVAPVG